MTWGDPPKLEPTKPTQGKKEYNRLNVARWRAANKERNLENQRKYKETNSDKIKAQNKAQYEKDKETKKARAEKFRKENEKFVLNRYKERNKRHRVKAQIWQNNKTKTDVQFKLVRNLRSRLAQALKGNQKTGSAIALLGCSIANLKEHLKSQFVKGMSWGNYGEWHIDHIKPLAKFDLTDENNVKMLCHYTNLQPLWAKDNIAKRDKISDVAKSTQVCINSLKSWEENNPGNASC